MVILKSECKCILKLCLDLFNFKASEHLFKLHRGVEWNIKPTNERCFDKLDTVEKSYDPTLFRSCKHLKE